MTTNKFIIFYFTVIILSGKMVSLWFMYAGAAKKFDALIIAVNIDVYRYMYLFTFNFSFGLSLLCEWNFSFGIYKMFYMLFVVMAWTRLDFGANVS